MSVSEAEIITTQESAMLVTMRVNQQLFGIPVRHVRDVLKEYSIASIPLAQPDILGSINLRGRIVTVIDVRKRLGLEDGAKGAKRMFVVVEHHSQYYSLLVDSVGEVLTIPVSQIDKALNNLDPAWREVVCGIYRLPEELLVIIDTHIFLTL